MNPILMFIFFISVSFIYCSDNILDSKESFVSSIGRRGPTCFLSFARTGEKKEYIKLITSINEGLQVLRIKTYFDMNSDYKRGLQFGQKIDAFIANIKTTQFVICFLTENYVTRSNDEGSGLYKEFILTKDRLLGDDSFFIPVVLDSSIQDAVPIAFRGRLCITDHDLDENIIMKNILMKIYNFHLTHYFKGSARIEVENLLLPLATHASLNSSNMGSQQLFCTPSQSNSSESSTDFSSNDIRSKKVVKQFLLKDYEIGSLGEYYDNDDEEALIESKCHQLEIEDLTPL